MILTHKPLLLAIDDQRFYLDEIAYEIEGKNIEYKAFEGPSSFEEEAKEEDVNRASLIFVDYDFQSCTAVDRDIVGYIKETFPRFKGKIVLLSLLDDFLEDNKTIQNKFDGILNKKDLSWDRIKAYLD